MRCPECLKRIRDKNPLLTRGSFTACTKCFLKRADALMKQADEPQLKQAIRLLDTVTRAQLGVLRAYEGKLGMSERLCDRMSGNKRSDLKLR